MHGGATGSGAPEGNRNALKHGSYGGELRQLCSRVREMLRGSAKLLRT